VLDLHGPERWFGFPGYLTGLQTIRPLTRSFAKKGNRIVHPPGPSRLEFAAKFLATSNCFDYRGDLMA
jgi:hypothetical protein